MDDYERGKRFGHLLNKHALDTFHFFQYILNLSVIPLFYILFQPWLNKFVTYNQILFIGEYTVLYGILHFISELLKDYYFKKTELTKLEEIFGAENAKGISIFYLVLFGIIGIPESKDFWRGLRETYWYMKIYYPLTFIFVILIVIPVIIFMLVTFYYLLKSITAK